MAKKSRQKTPAAIAKKPKASVSKVTNTATKSHKKFPKLPSAWWLTKRAAWLLWEHKRIFIGLTLIYGLLNILLVRGLAGGTNVSELKSELDQIITGHFGSLASGLSVFVLLLGSSGNNSSNTAGAYQLFVTLITSLAVIWVLRQLLSRNYNLRLRDAFYQGMYPLVPFILVLIVIGLQLIPMIIGSTLYTLVISNGIAVHIVEKLVVWGLFAILSLLSLYLVTSSLFALYIVTLPNMTPMKALRSARGLVRGRRWAILRKILWLPLALLIVAAIIMLPIIIWLTPLAQWTFFLLTMLGLVAIHVYMYTLYRELLNE